MKSRVLRWIVVLVAILAAAGSAYQVWSLEQAVAAERSAADTFERRARQFVVTLAEVRGILQAYVADGQVSESWQKVAAEQIPSLSTQAAALRELARSPEGQGSVEAAVEGVANLPKIEARAREYLASSQRLSASDIVFADAAPHIGRTIVAVDTARGHEAVASAVRLEQLRVQQLSWLGGAAFVALLALLLLAPTPAQPNVPSNGDAAEDSPGASLGIGHIAAGGTVPSPAQAPKPVDLVPSLADTAELCAALARVQEPRELPSLLEKAAAVLHTTGVVVWMPDGPGGALRPTLAHGYPPLVVTRMGPIPSDADNATAAAFRTKTLQIIPSEGTEPGAIAAPLVTADGCSGVMTAEIRPGVSADSTGSAAVIIAAQLATLISPQPPSPTRPE